jgi:hypothetical protein
MIVTCVKLMGKIRVRIWSFTFVVIRSSFFNHWGHNKENIPRLFGKGKLKKLFEDFSWRSYIQGRNIDNTYWVYEGMWKVKVAWHFVFSMLHWKKTAKGNKRVNLCKFYGYPLHLKGIILLVNYKWDKHYYLIMLV